MSEKMTPEEFLAKMQECVTGDIERDHGAADDLMCNLLIQLGYGEGIKIFKEMERWYA